MNTQQVLQAISTLRVSASPQEMDLHRALAQAFEAAQLPYRHEYALAPRRRIDFFIDGVGVEVKKGRPNASALRSQIARYLESEQLREIVVVTQREVPLPASVLGKRVTGVSLNRLWGVALG